MHLMIWALALLTGIAGWYYLFDSRAVDRLAGVEQSGSNRWRKRFRRLGGASMLLLAIALYAGSGAVDPQRDPVLFVWTWFGIALLTGLVVVLAMIDLRLAWQLRKVHRREDT